MSFFSSGKTPGTLGGKLAELADTVDSNRIAKRVDKLGPSFLQMGDYSERGITNWIRQNDVSPEELQAMKPIIQRYRDSFDRSTAQARQKGEDEWTASRRKRQGELDVRNDELLAQQKLLGEQNIAEGAYKAEHRGEVSGLDQIKMLVEKAKLAKLHQGGSPSIKDRQFQAENAMKDLSSRLAGMSVQVDPEAGSFTIPVNKEGQPDPNVLRMIDQSGFNYTTGKKVKTTDKWFNNDYGIQVHLGAFKGNGQGGQGQRVASRQGSTPSASDFAGPTPPEGAPAPTEKRLSAADFLNKKRQGSAPGTSDIETMSPGDIKSLSLTTGEGVYGAPETYEAPESIFTKIQKLASKTQPGQKFGEGPIGYALRAIGVEDDLAKQKEITRKLKERYPDASEDQIAQAILKSTQQVAQAN